MGGHDGRSYTGDVFVLSTDLEIIKKVADSELKFALIDNTNVAVEQDKVVALVSGGGISHLIEANAKTKTVRKIQSFEWVWVILRLFFHQNIFLSQK